MPGFNVPSPSIPPFQRVVNVDDYHRVREDIFDIYVAVNSQPHVQEILRKRPVSTAKNEAIEYGDAAENYDPHKLVIQKINAVRTQRTLVTAILLFVIGVYHTFIGSVPAVVMTIADWVMFSPHQAGSGLIAFVASFSLLYVLSLRANRWVTQRMNKELRYYGPTILSCRSEPAIRSYRMWNRSLNKPLTLSCIGLATIGYNLSPGLYDHAMGLVEKHLPPLVDSYSAYRLN